MIYGAMQMNFIISDKLTQESIREYAYRLVSTNILNLNLVPGTALSEQDISVQLNISRTPVREAFIRLAQEDLLDILPQRGTYVAKIDLQQVAEARFLREVMEHAIIKIACRDFPEDALFNLKICLKKQENCVIKEDFDGFFDLDWSMHGIIFNACNKSRIWQIITQMSMNYSRVRILNLKNGQYELPKLFHQHKQLIDAIETKDYGLGEKIIAIHINKVILDIEDLKKIYIGYFI
ncbi:DNA-binding transcriptional regulator, GntR family [Propionispira arboris]|uniref:DNA-binding transcriptional regulator, GntR family n=2 Tax=Propionispira arboris TaxID=84035 RepID=A0A1H6ZQJ2_9FIRM|nr:DNA-binding transcriptional regulator, GntR family [Propionispira arboris]